jgi:hypothetical protein
MMRKRFRGFARFAVLGAIVTAACGPGKSPTGQPPMVTISKTAVDAFRQDFNAAADRARVILLLSPT